ncbi:conserved membrane hypothetical protein [Bosea sp. 62]|uniref:DUF2339 domain-containing protein n=1 Tax=unclassified Bosea (in: a-proteobacteria) TaxID=2653178 RepID=UPI00125B570C|nr:MULTISPECIES: DUF2339 domain-containing protein [unclassified Bosea (in: a-proteobacteria)]CAD5260862.1 conserved membrane hypothetical protein [Bosea sp. 46]CAD5265409.1 conserved membrane hypothetical protein [Bosea sp. 21B]CAD5274947.1 conserved membrane hypothetical protein [Bosea sp. 7B]VVT59206.1 conserved membrane hypothetical protein [Bosea sp. EC-HK365B]VXB73510.1 conserved membrane hypothetical protein [Bosea sp. 29B]
MEWGILGLLLGLFFFVIVPWVALRASGRSNTALDQIAQLKTELAVLREELAALRGGGVPVLAAAPATEVAHSETALEAESPLSAEMQAPKPQLAAEAASPEAEALEPLASPAETIPLAARMAAEAHVEPALALERFEEEALQEQYAREAQEAPQEPEAQIGPPLPRRDIEETIGSRWAVWIGGVALAFGGLFLVRYSIEAGLFGPGVRLLMGAVFALLLAGASEYLRRREAPLPFNAPGALGNANIPSVLAGVSVLAGFGVVFAAHAIYGFIGPTPAFAMMALIGLAALAASLLHGPALGLFGLAGSYVTPFLIASTAPAFASLSLFIAFVTATAFLLHLRRPSRVVTLAAVAGHGAWTVLIAFTMRGLLWPSFLVGAGAVLAWLLLKELPLWRRRGEVAARRPVPFDLTGLVAIAVPLVISGVLWVGMGAPGSLHLAILATVAVGIVAAVRHRDLAPLALVAAAGAVGMILLWPRQNEALGLSPATLLDLVRLSIAPDAGPGLAWTAALFAVVIGGLPFAALVTRRLAGAGGYVERGCLAFASALAPVCLLLATTLRVNGFERAPGFAALAALLVAVLFLASELLLRVERASTRSPNSLALVGSAAYAAAAAIALGLAVALALRETWLVVGFAIASAGLAILARARPLPLLRTMSASLATAAFARWVWDPILTGMGSRPLLNWLIPAYALPALCFGVAALALRGTQDRPRIVHQALAALFTAAFVLLQVHQLFVGPDLTPDLARITGHYTQPRNRLFEEVACLVIAAGLLGAGFQRLGRGAGNAVFRIAGLAAAALTIPLAIGGLGALLNPLFDGTTVDGWPVLNRLLCYVVAGAALGALGFTTSREGGSPVSDALSACGAFLVSLGLVLITRHAFAGPQLSPVDGASVGYAESVMIAVVLIALTAAARLWHDASRGRIASLAVVTLGCISIGWIVLALGFARNPFLDGRAVEGPVVFNRILWGYGLAALVLAGAGLWLRDGFSRLSRAFGLTAAMAAIGCVFLLLRHALHGPSLSSEVPITLAESGIYAALGFMLAIAMMIAGSVRWLGRSVPVDPLAATLAACGFFAGVAFIACPVVTDQPLAGVLILDNALVGYLLPAAFAFAASAWARAHLGRPLIARAYGVAAILGALAYVVTEVRRTFVGPDLFSADVGAGELYAYSAAILLYGVALLALGFRAGSRDLRLASLGIVTIAICKAFLVDMSGLEGLLRALSFIGLGASLVAIGLAYQRLLRRGTSAAASLGA